MEAMCTEQKCIHTDTEGHFAQISHKIYIKYTQMQPQVLQPYTQTQTLFVDWYWLLHC